MRRMRRVRLDLSGIQGARRAGFQRKSELCPHYGLLSVPGSRPAEGEINVFDLAVEPMTKPLHGTARQIRPAPFIGRDGRRTDGAARFFLTFANLGGWSVFSMAARISASTYMGLGVPRSG